jgi:phage virion morphogenesis protein
MAGARITVDLDPVMAAIDRLAAAGKETRGLMDAIGAHVEARTAERFELEQAPGGGRWPASIRAQAEGGQTLTDTGRLRASITRDATDRTATVGTNVVYAAINQFGGTVRAKTPKGLRFKVGGGWVRKQSVTLPPRPFLGIDDDDRTEIALIAEDWLRRAVPEARP